MSRNSAGKKFFGNVLVLEIGLIVLLLIFGSLMFSFIENHSFFDSLYFMVMTMSTVGFGDIIPHTDLGKGLVIIYSLIGIPLFVSLSGLILENRFNRTVKNHVNKFYREIQEAEREIQAMEERVSDELSDVMEEEELNETKIDRTQKDVVKTEKQVEKIEKVLENEIMEDKKPWWKKISKK